MFFSTSKGGDNAKCVLRHLRRTYYASCYQNGFNGLRFKTISMMSFRIVLPFAGTITGNNIILVSMRIDPVSGSEDQVHYAIRCTPRSRLRPVYMPPFWRQPFRE